MKQETKEIIFATSLFAVACGISLSMLFGISGCTLTEKQKAIDKISTEIKEVIVDNTKPETKTEDPTVNKQTEEETALETPQGTTETLDDFHISDLTFNVAVDSPQLANHFTGFKNQSHPWALMKDLPVTVIIKRFSASGIDLEGVPQGQYTDKGWERTSTFWAFDENGVELGYEDHAYTSYEQPGKFYGKCKYILVVRCSDISAIARSKVTEVK